MKTKEQIRQETPLSVTTMDNAIYEVTEIVNSKIYDVQDWGGTRKTWWTLEHVTLGPGDRLRLLQCDDDEKDNVYRWGDGTLFVKIPDSKMKYISGNLGTKA